MRTLTVLLVSLAFASGALAQEQAPDRNRVVLAQAGGSARGAGVSAGASGAGATVIAVIAIAVAGAAAAATNNGVVTTAAHH